MRILELIATVLGLSVFSMSCSSGHGTAPQTPLTDAQKATLKTTVSNLTLISNAASSGAMTSQTGTSTSVVSTSDSSVPPQQQKMVQSLNKSSCAYQMTPITDTDSTTSPFNFSLQVNGSGCPVSMNYKITSGAAQGNQQSIQFDMEYLVMDNNFRALNDIDQISVHGPMSFNQSLNTFSSDLQGSIHSQLNGPKAPHLLRKAVPRAF